MLILYIIYLYYIYIYISSKLAYDSDVAQTDKKTPSPASDLYYTMK
jgi:hypothetical protein